MKKTRSHYSIIQMKISRLIHLFLVNEQTTTIVIMSQYTVRKYVLKEFTKETIRYCQLLNKVNS